MAQETETALIGVEPIIHIGAIWFHRNIVADIKQEEQREGHQDACRKRHEEQPDAAHDRADQKIGGAPTPTRTGAVAHRSNDWLDDQARQRPGDTQPCKIGFFCTEITPDGGHIGLLQAKAELQPEEPEVHLQDLRNRQVRFGHGRHGLFSLMPKLRIHANDCNTQIRLK